MAFNITSGNISTNVLYNVAGAQSVVYNGTTYTTGQNFRGTTGVKTFTYTGTGTQLLYEVTELKGDGIELVENGLDYGLDPNPANFKGFGIEYLQSGNDIVVPDTTALSGFGIEFLDYPFYSFAITETRL